MSPELVGRPFSSDEARTVVAWAYEPPLDRYDLSGDDAVARLLARDERGHGDYPVLDGADVVGFGCFGAEARVHARRSRPARATSVRVSIPAC